MPAWLIKLLGINWKTTVAAITSLGAIGAAIIAAWTAKDFQAIFDNLPLFFTALAVVVTNIGLWQAKDKNVTGVQKQAVSVDSTGAATNVKGEPVGKQSTVPPRGQ